MATAASTTDSEEDFASHGAILAVCWWPWRQGFDLSGQLTAVVSAQRRNPARRRLPAGGKWIRTIGTGKISFRLETDLRRIRGDSGFRTNSISTCARMPPHMPAEARGDQSYGFVRLEGRLNSTRIPQVLHQFTRGSEKYLGLHGDALLLLTHTLSCAVGGE
jgi:hypothetical protein